MYGGEEQALYGKKLAQWWHVNSGSPRDGSPAACSRCTMRSRSSPPRCARPCKCSFDTAQLSPQFSSSGCVACSSVHNALLKLKATPALFACVCQRCAAIGRFGRWRGRLHGRHRKLSAPGAVFTQFSYRQWDSLDHKRRTPVIPDEARNLNSQG